MMALAGGIQCIDHLSQRFSLHGLSDDRYVFKPPSFSFSWSEPFHLDSVAASLSTTKRSHSLPTRLTTRTSEHRKEDKEKLRDPKPHNYFLNNKRAGSESTHVRRPQTRPCKKYANQAPESCERFEEESSDEELCELMAERENIPIAANVPSMGDKDTPFKFDHICVERCPGGVTSRKRYLEADKEFCITKEPKRPRPRLDFDKVRLSRTHTIERCRDTPPRTGTFAPIDNSDSEENN